MWSHLRHLQLFRYHCHRQVINHLDRSAVSPLPFAPLTEPTEKNTEGPSNPKPPSTATRVLYILLCAQSVQRVRSQYSIPQVFLCFQFDINQKTWSHMSVDQQCFILSVQRRLDLCPALQTQRLLGRMAAGEGSQTRAGDTCVFGKTTGCHIEDIKLPAAWFLSERGVWTHVSKACRSTSICGWQIWMNTKSDAASWTSRIPLRFLQRNLGASSECTQVSKCLSHMWCDGWADRVTASVWNTRRKTLTRIERDREVDTKGKTGAWVAHTSDRFIMI